MYKKYEAPTVEQLKFFMNEGMNFVKEKTKELGKPYDVEGDVFVGELFLYISDKMLKSNNPEIKIEFSRFLMFQGFRELTAKMGEFVKEKGLV